MELSAKAYPDNQPLESIYLGGGTPSLLTGEQVESLISSSIELFGHKPDIEITIEANPGTTTLKKLEGYCQSGVNRLSIGVQSFDDGLLATLGRIHRKEEIFDTLEWAKNAGYRTIGLDLICGLPGQTEKSWHNDLAQAVSMEPQHLSIYGLSIEPGTHFARIYPNDSELLPGNDTTANMLEDANSLLAREGFEHYEISNFALPGHRSRHNCGYWNRDGYLGIGPGAHSFLKKGWGIRWGNQPDYKLWSESVMSSSLSASVPQNLTREEAMSEALFLGLRMKDGILFDSFSGQFAEDIESRFEEDIRQLQKAGLLNCISQNISLTSRGMLLSNQVFVRFI